MKHTGLAAVLALTLSGTSLYALADDEGEEEYEGAGTEKVVLCHKGKNSIRVGAPGLAAHLAHGDTEGYCDGNGEPGDGGDNGGYDGAVAVVMMRCDVPEVGEGIEPSFEVVAFSSSAEFIEGPLSGVGNGDDCADALAAAIMSAYTQRYS